MLLLMTRLPLAPLAAKAQRDRLAMRAIADQTAQLRSHYVSDGFRLLRAVQQLRQQHGLTPWRNLAVSLLQMGVFLICFAAVRASAQWSNESFAWLELLREPDPLGVLSVAIAITVCALTWRLLVDMPMHRVLRWALGALAGLLMLWLSWDLSAAISLYLLGSMALLWLQQRPWRERMLRTRAWWAARKALLQARSLTAMPLELCKQASVVGNKAWRQGQMRLAGLPVPPGWAWPVQSLEPTPADVLVELRALGLDPQARYAVRSSGIAEDSATQSFAGVFRSELQVPFADVPPAMQRVRASYAAVAGAAHTGGVIVQAMVQAEYAGVLFTRDPGNAGAMLIEWVAGLGEALASGRATPGALRVGRVSGLPLGVAAPCPLDMAPLVALAHSIESQFGSAQDIEWAFAQGSFYILQARDIVAMQPVASSELDPHTLIERERERLLSLLAFSVASPDAPALMQTDMTADLPRPTPLSLSLMQRLRGDGGSTDRAFERLGLRWQIGPHRGPHSALPSVPEVQSAFGQTYVLQAQAQVPLMGVLAAFHLSRSAATIETHFRETFLPGHLQAMRWREVMDLQSLTDAELMAALETWTRQFVEDHYVEADVINIAAEFYARTSAKALAAKGLSPALQVASTAEPSVAPTLVTHGHRAVHDWELSEPRYDEDPAMFARHFGASAVGQTSAAHMGSSAVTGSHADAAPGKGRKLLDSSVERAQRFARLKEDAKHALLREWAQLRRLFLALDQRLAGDGLVFYLELAELPALLSPAVGALRQRAAHRRAQALAFRSVVVGPSLSVRELETRTDWLRAFVPQGPAVAAANGLKGLRVSGLQEVTATVRLLRHADDLAHLRPGEIAVVGLADPVWLGCFDRAAGLVSEVGGWLAHLAILAREKDLPAVFGVPQAMQQLRSGDVVTLGVDGSVRVQQRL